MKKHLIGIPVLLLFVFTSSFYAQSKLTVNKIMSDPAWIGFLPENPFWSADSRSVYFNWNPENKINTPLYRYDIESETLSEVSIDEEKNLPSNYGVFNSKHTYKVYSQNGDLFIQSMTDYTIERLTETNDYESGPQFGENENIVFFTKQDNLFELNRKTGFLRQITDIKSGNKPSEKKENPHKKWLRDEQSILFNTLVKKESERDSAKSRRNSLKWKYPTTIYTGEFNVGGLTISPDQKFVTITLYKAPSGEKRTLIPEFVTRSGFTSTDEAYAKVGDEQYEYKTGIYDTERDTFYYVDLTTIPGIYDKPEYLFEYDPDQDSLFENPRDVIVHEPTWSDDAKFAVCVVRSTDNKDRWILKLTPENGKFILLDRQRDEAWIDGPGISNKWSTGDVGFLPENRRFYFQSEKTGYSHLYTVDLVTGEIAQLTSGKYEVFNPQISRDGKYWYYTSSEVNAGERHFYRMPIEGGKAVKLTSGTGNNQVSLSPDEKHLLIRYSYSNKPWELYLQKTGMNEEPVKITTSLSEEFQAYNWRDPQIIHFMAQDGEKVPARLYVPEKETSNGAAVIFVHGAGYLQNAHKWWSHYFREYMFHNLLTDLGYTVLDIDYRGSKGYGRDWRTAIYRFMGGKDLSDQVDGAKYLIDNFGVIPGKIGIYGGSYGGFITLKAMFNHPDVFAAGAALRSVTDWAHYHHGYTSNILNTPVSDSLAYVRSSPIYEAEGLSGHLLMCHGMIDDNVHFQDIVRLTQRLIELGKDNWELAVYPLERHSFTEPESWTDEYKRILNLFESTIGK